MSTAEEKLRAAHDSACEELAAAKEELRAAVNRLRIATRRELLATAAAWASNGEDGEKILINVAHTSRSGWSGGSTNPSNIIESLAREAALELLNSPPPSIRRKEKP